MQFEEVKKFILGKLEKELTKTLTYHSLEHVHDVYTAAEQLAEMENIAGDDLTLLLTAVLFHDSGFISAPKDHERISCSIASEYLPEYGYTPGQIESICGIIMATHVPQTPHTKLEQIMCDADLDYLGRDDFFVIGDRLYNELTKYGMTGGENEWNKMQVRFLEHHHYFTPSAIKLRQETKAKNLQKVKSKIKPE